MTTRPKRRRRSTGVHQGDAAADLGRDHEAGIHDAVLPRHGDRLDLRARSAVSEVAGDDGETLVDGEVLESDPPQMLAHTWRALYDPETASRGASRVTWEIEAQTAA